MFIQRQGLDLPTDNGTPHDSRELSTNFQKLDRTNRILCGVQLVLWIGTIVASGIIMNKNRTGAGTDVAESPLTPASWTFFIWLPIYSLIIYMLFFQVLGPKDIWQSSRLVAAWHSSMFIAIIGMLGWLVAFQQKAYIAGQVIISLGAIGANGMLITSLQNTKQRRKREMAMKIEELHLIGPPTVTWRAKPRYNWQRILWYSAMRLPLALFAGWSIVASFVQTGLLETRPGVTPWTCSTWCFIESGLALCAGGMAAVLNDVAYALVGVWALSGQLWRLSSSGSEGNADRTCAEEMRSSVVTALFLISGLAMFCIVRNLAGPIRQRLFDKRVGSVGVPASLGETGSNLSSFSLSSGMLESPINQRQSPKKTVSPSAQSPQPDISVIPDTGAGLDSPIAPLHASSTNFNDDLSGH